MQSDENKQGFGLFRVNSAEGACPERSRRIEVSKVAVAEWLQFAQPGGWKNG